MSPQKSPADKAEKLLDHLIAAKGGSRRDGQVQMAREVAESISSSKPLLIQGGTGIGKALDVDTPIPTLEGWVRMGDLEAGVHHPFDEMGRPCNITKAFDILHGRTCYQLSFLAGGSIVADAGHLWTVITDYASRVARKHGETDPWARAKTMKTVDLLDNLRVRNRDNYRIPGAHPIQAPERDLPIDPYSLGYWLASTERGWDTDGTVNPRAIPEDPLDGFTITQASKATYLVTPTKATLKKLDALGLVKDPDVDGATPDRFIPEMYQFASEDQRRALLSGFLDARATARRAPRAHIGQVTVYKTQVQLMNDVHALACSLGIRAAVADNTIQTMTYRRVHFTPSEQLFRVPAKMAEAGDFEAAATAQKRGYYRSITNIERVPTRPVRCIAVDSESHLFLAGRDFIPTHNSMAYLAGALASGAKTAVAPHTKALQDQLAEDLDLVSDAFQDYDFAADEAVLDHAPTYAVIKGRSSYFCGNKVAAGDDGQEALPVDAEGEVPESNSALGKEVKALMEWAKTTDTGDRADAPPVSFRAWSMVAGSVDDCTANGCKKNPSLCFAEQARLRAEDVDIVVVNQAYLAAAMRIEHLDLGCEAVVVDECHEFPSVVADAFGATLKRRRVEQTMKRATNLLSSIGTIDGDQAESWNKDCDQRLGDLEAHLGKMSRFGQDRDIVETPPIRKDLEGLRDLLAPVRRKVRSTVDSAPDEKTKGNRQSLHQALDNLINDIRLILTGSDDYQVVWADFDESRKPVIHCARFDVSETVHEQLIERITEGRLVMTSATLTVGGKFDHPADQMGFTIDEETFPWTGTIVQSPFDYQAQGRIWVPEGMPEPKNTKEAKEVYAQAVGDVAAKVARAAEGRTLVLCTSWASVGTVSDQLRDALAGTGIEVLAQEKGDSPRQVAAKFASADKAVLVGTRTFWTGVSFEGSTCISVVVEKVPFPVPSDPIIAARTDKADTQYGERAGFLRVSLAEAILTIVQGAGRLIRTVNDKGVVVLCDPRLNPTSRFKKSYAVAVRDSLPPFPWTRSEEEALGFLSEIAKSASAEDAPDDVVEVEEAAEDVTEVVEGPVAV